MFCVQGSMCDAVCENGYGFFNEPAPKYSCDQGGVWAPAGRAPDCYGKYKIIVFLKSHYIID